MDTQFEALPFEGEGEEEWEGERGRMFGRGAAPRRPARPLFKPPRAAGPLRAPPGRWPGLGRGPKPPPHPHPRPYPRPRPGGGLWPRYIPSWGPYWPLDVIALPSVVDGGPAPWPDDGPSSEPWPDQGPGQEPWPDRADGFGDEPWPQQETPPVLQAALNRLPAATRPAYAALGALPQAVNDVRSRGPGLYAITFNVGGQPRAYSGQAGDVRRRLQQHLLCARMLGLDVSGHQAFVAPMPAAAPQQRRAVERSLHATMFASQPGVLTNQRRELELEVLGPAWS